MGLLLYPKLNTLSLWPARNTWKMRSVFSSSLPASSSSHSKIDGGRSSFLTITTAISCVFVCTLAASAAHNEKKSRKKETFLALRLDRESEQSARHDDSCPPPRRCRRRHHPDMTSHRESRKSTGFCYICRRKWHDVATLLCFMLVYFQLELFSSLCLLFLAQGSSSGWAQRRRLEFT